MARLTEAHASARSYARDGGHAAARRRLGAVRSALVAGGDEAATVLEVASEIAQTAGLSLSDEDGVWGEIYKEIGVTPVINATGSVTILGGSTPHPEVSAAMDKANSAFVPLWELQKAAGASVALPLPPHVLHTKLTSASMSKVLLSPRWWACPVLW